MALIVVAIYRVPDFVSGVMANPLYIDLGFSKTAIATVTKIYGVFGIAGVFAGGLAVLGLGLIPELLIGGIAASASHLTFAWLALAGAQLDLLTLAIGIESFASGFAGTALIALPPRQRFGRTAAAQDDEIVGIRDDMSAEILAPARQTPMFQEAVHRGWAGKREAGCPRARRVCPTPATEGA